MYISQKLVSFIVIFSVLVFSIESVEDDEAGLIERLITSGSQVFHSSLQHRKERPIPCTCGIFLESQLLGNYDEPQGNPAFTKELVIPMLPCGYRGNKLCQDRCLDEVVPHITRIGPIMCSAMERNCHRERATLFTKNCDNVWKSSGLTLGREFCCFNGLQIKCPRNWFGQGGGSQFSTMASSVISELFEAPPENRRTIPEVIFELADKAVDFVTDVLKPAKKI